MSQRKQKSSRPQSAHPQSARAPGAVPEELSEEQVENILKVRSFFQGNSYGVDEVSGEIYAGRDLAELIAVLMRYAQRLDGAPERCRNPRCRSKGACLLALDEDDTAICRGGIRPAAIDATALLLGGLIEVGKHYVPEWFEERAA